MRSSAGESQALAAQRAREAARARTRENSSEMTASEGGDDVPREDFESAANAGSEGVPLDESPRWPDEASESAFLAEQGSAPQRAVFTPTKKAEESDAAPAAG
ncbi:MAG TPA: hypothetical protein VIM69_05495, partial [Opitutaceae bacterium]